MSRFAFDRTEHDRQAPQRAAELWLHPDARALVLGGEHIASLDGERLRWIGVDQAPPGELILLGDQDGRQQVAVSVSRVPQDLQPMSLRAMAANLSSGELSLAVHAVAMSRWLASSGFCPNCGTRTEVRQAGHLRECPEPPGGCGKQQFPRSDPAVIMLITDDADRALLGRQAAWPEHRFSTLAGFVEPGESLEDAVRREVAEEAGVTVGEVRYAASQPWPFPSSLMIGFFGQAVTTAITLDDNELAEALWVSRAELIERGRAKTMLLPPSGISVSSWLIETWLADKIPAGWD